MRPVLAVLFTVMAVSVAAHAAEAADDEHLSNLLKAAGDGSDREALAALANKVPQADIRQKAVDLVPDLEKAGTLARRLTQLRKDIEAVKGGGLKTEVGGPAWLRERVPASAMSLFDQPVEIDLWDRTLAIKGGKRNEALTDDWLARLGGLPGVRSLNLQSADLKGPGLRNVGTLTTLESLNLTLVPVKDDALEHLKDLAALKGLFLASTQVTGTGFRHLGKLDKVTNVNLHYTPVDDAGLEQIVRLPAIERLEIVHCQFTDASAGHLAKMKALRRLQLGSRKATGAVLAGLRDLPELREVDLHDGQTSLEGVGHVAEVKGLRVLRVYGGGAGDEGAAKVAKLGELESLVLEGTGITDAGLEALAGLTKLKRMQLGEPKVTAGAVERLKAARPGLEVVK